MVTIQIGNTTPRTLIDPRDVDESWVNQQINRRRQAGEPVCVRVIIKTASIDFMLYSNGCSGGRGMNRDLTPQEQGAFELWERAGLRKANFQGGGLIAFLKQLRRVTG